MRNDSYITTAEDDMEYELNEHREQAHKLLIQGLIGFGGGCLFFLSTFSFAFVANSNLSEITPGELILVVLGGLCCAGLPYGWELVNHAVGGWSIWGHIVVVVLLFALKLYASLLVGLFAYPIALIYHMVKAKRGKDLVMYAAVSIVLLTLIIWILAWAEGISKNQQHPNDIDPSTSGIIEPSNEQEECKPVTAGSFTEHTEELSEICKIALSRAQEKELEYIDMGWEVTQTAQIHGIYFMNAKDPGDPHWYMSKAIDIYNAVAVVTGCFVEEAGPLAINQWQMQVWIFPNFTYGAGDALIYEKANIYHESQRSGDLNELMDWLKSEYDDMTFSKLSVP